jgi:hypothetical protein
MNLESTNGNHQRERESVRVSERESAGDRFLEARASGEVHA